MSRAIHISACAVLLVATMIAASQEGVTIRITGPVRIIVGTPGTTEEGCGKQCPDEFVLLGDECFLIVGEWSEMRSWEAARNYCQEKGGYLAEPSNLSALGNYLRDRGHDSGFWVGARGSKWVSGTSITKGWGEDEPSGYLGESGDCIRFVLGYSPDGLHDGPCKAERLFVCEV